MSDSDFFDLPIRLHAVNGVRIAARVGGDGPPLLLLHGHPQTSAIWHRLWPALTRHRTCVAADLRGYGDSDSRRPRLATPRIPSASWPRTWRR